MFCPEGYVPFSKLAGTEIERQSLGLLETAKAFVGDEYTRTAENGRFVFPERFYAISPMDWSEFGLFRAFEESLWMSSREGQMLKLDVKSIQSAVRFIEFNILDARRNDEFTPLILQKLKLHGETHYFLGRKVNVFDEFREDWIAEANAPGVKSPDNPWKLAALRNFNTLHFLLPLWFERAAYTVDLDAYQILARNNYQILSEFHAIAQVISPYQGWSLCVREDDVDSGLQRFRGGIDEDSEVERIKRSVRDERTAINLLTQHLASIPSGSWSGTKEELMKLLPFKIGPQAQKRVMDHLRQEFPEVSKPGRRPGKN